MRKTKAATKAIQIAKPVELSKEERRERARMAAQQRDAALEPFRLAAFEKAQKLFGPGGVVGINWQHHETPFHVGKKENGDWKLFGKGSSWEAAFLDVKVVPLHGKPF